MDEKQKIDVAVFRYAVIQDFVTGIEQEYGKQEQLLQEKCARKWLIPFSNKTSISRSTLKRWICLYRSSGGKLESLYPNDREDKGEPRVLDTDVCMLLLRLRREHPEASITFIRERIVKEKLFPKIPSISTLYRFYHHHDLMKKRMPAEDRRRFEAEHPNDLWQSDVMHGPRVEINGRQGKSYLIAFIDDHSRLIVYAFFYASENTSAFMHAFEQALLGRGLPRKFYVDNGSAYRSRHLMHTTASLGIALIHARPYKPQGKGKIERFFKTVRSQFMPGFTGNSIEELNEGFAAWLEEYNNRKHSATGKKPLQRFADGMECIRPTPADLRDYFRKKVQRKITKDRTIMLDNHIYEGPVELIGKKVDLLFHEGEYDQVELRQGQKTYGILKPVDVHVNCRIKRDKNSKPVIEVVTPTAQTGGVWGRWLMSVKAHRVFFQLHKEPFTSDIAHKDILKTNEIEGVENRIHYAVNLGAIALITGDIGSGKSTALRYVSGNLHPSEYRLIHVTASNGSILELYRNILGKLNLEPTGTSRVAMVRRIKQEVLDTVNKKMKILLIIDEASLLRLEVFTELHTLTQFEGDSKPFLPMILAGQANLVDNLKYRYAMPLASRVVARCHLQGVNQQGMQDYLLHHLAIAGVEKNLFDPPAITAIHQGSGGLFRKANHLARGAIITAARDKQNLVTAEHVRIAASEIF